MKQADIKNFIKSYKLGILFVLLQIIGYPIAFLNSDSNFAFFIMAIIDIFVLIYFKSLMNKISSDKLDKLIDVSIIFSIISALIYLYQTTKDTGLLNFITSNNEVFIKDSPTENKGFFAPKNLLDMSSVAVSFLSILIGFRLSEAGKLFDNLVNKFRYSFIGANFILIVIFIFTTAYSNAQSLPKSLEIFIGTILTPVLLILIVWNKTLLIKLFLKDF